VRRVVVAHPYAANQTDFEVLELSADGTLAPQGAHFTMGRASSGTIVFTPDGELGFAVHDDGTIGVFRLDADGSPEVLNPAFAATGMASRLVVSPDGRWLYVLDTEFREVGGGVFRVEIGCEDDSLTDRGLFIPSKLPAALWTAGSSVLLASADVDGSSAGEDLHLLGSGESPARVSGVAAFPDTDAIIGGAVRTDDGRFVLLGDTNGFSDSNRRVAVVELSGETLSRRAILNNIEDPLSIVASPMNDLALVVSGFGNALIVLERSGSSYRSLGELAYEGQAPRLPGAAVRIDSGSLAGMVLVPELSGIRRLRFEAGSVRDLGVLATAETPGVLGVQP
jgi:hypothetical protein